MLNVHFTPMTQNEGQHTVVLKGTPAQLKAAAKYILDCAEFFESSMASEAQASLYGQFSPETLEKKLVNGKRGW